MKLASRFSRLLATIIDTMVISVITGIILLPFLIFKIGNPLIHQITIPIAGFILFYLINKKSLINEGQTIGKGVLKIKIVNKNYTSCSSNILFKRYLVLFIPTYIPFIGAWLATINCLFILNKNKQCLHDIVAKTIVVEVGK